MVPNHLMAFLLKLFTCTSLVGSLAWIVDYSRDKWWRNVVGKNLVTKTIIICLLLGIALAFDFFTLSALAREILLWCYIVLLGCIGPVMVWRMWVFHKVSGNVIRCPNGHFVTAGVTYCSQCGFLVNSPAPPPVSPPAG